MSATTDAGGLIAGLRAAVQTLRAAEFAVARAAAALAASEVPAVSGYRSGGRLIEDAVRVDPSTATRWVAHGRQLGPGRSFTGEPMPPARPSTAQVAEAGLVGAEHVRVIVRAMDAVERVPGLEPDVVAGAEATLAGAATQLAPHGVEKVAKRLLAHLDPDGAAPLDPPQDADELHLSTSRRDGSVSISGRIHGAGDAELLREAFDALSTPAGPDDARSIGRRRADALLELAEQAVGSSGVAAEDRAPDGADDTPVADEAPEPSGSPEAGAPRAAADGPVRGRPLLMITIDHEWLRGAVGHGLLDSDRTIAASEARRLACDAGVVPAVLGTRSQPLDVGRLSYTVPDGMRRALHHRDRGCAFPGCTRRPRRCHAHHVNHWADGGATGIDNLTLLCRFHHQLVHHGDWEIRMREGRPWFVPPAWIDPTRTPRPGGPHPARL